MNRVARGPPALGTEVYIRVRVPCMPQLQLRSVAKWDSSPWLRQSCVNWKRTIRVRQNALQVLSYLPQTNALLLRRTTSEKRSTHGMQESWIPLAEGLEWRHGNPSGWHHPGLPAVDCVLVRHVDAHGAAV